ncbi:MAG: DegT/DnrJ/EryC1/StrS family aminotransferase [Rhizobiaceae bacterium]
MQPKVPFIDLKEQYRVLKPSIDARIQAVLDHGQYIMGPEVAELESCLAEYVGVEHCVGASSGTDTMMMALMAIGVGPGDEVITSPFSFIASAEVVSLVGATPVFVDIDPTTYNINSDLIEAAITERTKAIIPVSLYGQCADFDEINAIALRHNLVVVEDGAQSFGAEYKGKKSCGLSSVGSTSFFPSKPLGCYGDGGALFTNDQALADAFRQLRIHGQSSRYHHPIIGINGRLDTLQAAVLLSKMERFEQEVEARQNVATRYRELVSIQCPTVVLPYLHSHNVSVYAQFTIRVDNRDAVRQKMIDNGVPVAVHYPVAINRQPAYQNTVEAGSTPVSDEMASKVLSLPMGPDLDSESQEMIVSTLASVLRDTA